MQLCYQCMRLDSRAGKGPGQPQLLHEQVGSSCQRQEGSGAGTSRLGEVPELHTQTATALMGMRSLVDRQLHSPGESQRQAREAVLSVMLEASLKRCSSCWVTASSFRAARKPRALFLMARLAACACTAECCNSRMSNLLTHRQASARGTQERGCIRAGTMM